MAVDLLGGRLVLGLELGLDVGRRLAVLLGTWWGGRVEQQANFIYLLKHYFISDY